MKENVVLFLGPSGAGKSGIIASLAGKDPNGLLPTLVPVATRVTIENLQVCLMDTPSDLLTIFNGNIFINHAKVIILVCSSEDSLQNEIPVLATKIKNVSTNNQPVLLVLRGIKKSNKSIDNFSEVIEFGDVDALQRSILQYVVESEPDLVKVGKEIKQKDHSNTSPQYFTESYKAKWSWKHYTNYGSRFVWCILSVEFLILFLPSLFNRS